MVTEAPVWHREGILPGQLLHKVVDPFAAAGQPLQVAEASGQRHLPDGVDIGEPFTQPIGFPACTKGCHAMLAIILPQEREESRKLSSLLVPMMTCYACEHLERRLQETEQHTHLLVPMLLSNAFNRTATSLLESANALASTSFEVYRINFRT